MNGHFSGEQLAAWLAGERSAEDARHLLGCAECSAAVARMEEPLALFRAAIRSAGDTAPAVRFVPARKPSPWRWSVPAAAALAMVTFFVHHEQTKRAAQDAALLDEVNTSVSRSVPAPFEKLWGKQ
jgi:hypothetical protein